MSADTAPAEMPGEEEIRAANARLVLELRDCRTLAQGYRRNAEEHLQDRLAAEARALAAEADSEQWQNLFESTRASLQQEINRLERELASEKERADMAVRQMIKQNDRLAAIRDEDQT